MAVLGQVDISVAKKLKDAEEGYTDRMPRNIIEMYDRMHIDFL